MYKYRFTIFTPTYNRAHCLNKLYNSLKKQSFSSFEWLIIDDGSLDNTKETVNGFINEGLFPIRYYYHDNVHKFHTVLRAVELAEGEFFYTVDSDDELVSEALTILNDTWLSIPEENRLKFSGVTGLCQDQFGKIVGGGIPHSPLDSDTLETSFRYKIKGEKSGFQKTSVMKRLLPLRDKYQLGRGLIQEGVLWVSIANMGLKTRYINDVLRVYYTNQKDSLTNNGSLKKCSYGSYEYTKLLLSSFKLYFLCNFRLTILTIVKYILSGRNERVSYGYLFFRLEKLILKILFLISIPVAYIYRNKL